MDKNDLELIERIGKEDEELNKLYKRHVKLEEEVKNCERYSPYSPSIDFKQKRLKREKLYGKDKMLSILAKYREMDCSSRAIL